MRISPGVAKGSALVAIGLAVMYFGDGGLMGVAASVMFFAGYFYLSVELAASPARHWRVFNILRRVMGLTFTFGGTGFLASTVYYARYPESTKGFATISGSAWLDTLAAGAFALSVGILCLTSRSYRPDLGDVAFSDRSMRLLWGLPRNWRRPTFVDQGKRRWWTGDVKVP